MDIEYVYLDSLNAEVFADLLWRSTLANRRPADDLERLSRMVAGANILVGAYDKSTGMLVGLARSLTDFSYSCYLSDLAVDQEYQGRGIGRHLVALTREKAGPETTCVLVSAPGVETFYKSLGMTRSERAFTLARDY